VTSEDAAPRAVHLKTSLPLLEALKHLGMPQPLHHLIAFLMPWRRTSIILGAYVCYAVKLSAGTLHADLWDGAPTVAGEHESRNGSSGIRSIRGKPSILGELVDMPW
jgi:hypothetical protein